MSRILWLGAGFFSKGVEGHDTEHIKFFQPRVLDWAEVVDEAGFEPDVLVFGDNSCPPALSGVHRYPCLTVLYAVDTHIHSWLPLYAQAFDLCLVSLKDHLQKFEKRLPRERLLWSPPYAHDIDLPREAETEFEVLFVGKSDPLKTPERYEFLSRLGERVPLAVESGSYRTLYPQAKIVLNEAWRGDLNFRTFEAPGCGACLVTPDVGHGLADIFEDGRDMFFYRQDDIEGLANLLNRLLDDPQARRRAAENGLAKVDGGHRMKHRAAAFENFLAGFDHRQLIVERLQTAPEIFDAWLRRIYLHWAEAVDDPALKAGYLKAARER